MAAASGASAAGGPSVAPSVQNIDIRVPKNQNKKLAIMRFNGSMGVDFVKWTHVKMERENNQVQFKGFNEDMPKFGAGSEYGREQREEARRKKYGIINRKYKPEDQPWILQHGGKAAGKKFRGVRDGGVAENASYYVFTQAPDGVFEAFPVQEQYSFQAVQNYKALSYEEAEEEFNSRNRTFNLFNVMVRKRMKKNDEDAEEEGEEEGEGKGKSKGKKKKGAKDSRFGDELDDMMDSSNGESSDDDDENDDEDGDKKKKKKGKKAAKPKKKRKQGSDDEALEDSDDGDGEGRELDYISSSDDESDADVEAKDELKGVAEEDALRKLLNSDEEDEDEEKQEDEDKDKDEEDAEGNEDHPGDKASKDEKDDKKKKKEKKKNNKDKKPRKEEYGSSSDSGDSSGSELDKAKPSPKTKSSSANSSRSATPTKPGTSQPETSSDSKRKGISEAILAQAAKKPRLDMNSATSSAASAASAAFSNANEGVNEESVRRYLSRKPMTTTELLQKFKSKRTGLTSEQLVPHIAQILKKINPVKQTIKGKMYLSIKG